MVRHFFVCCIVIGCAWSSVQGAARGAIPEIECLKPPTASRLQTIHQSAQIEGWATQTEALRLAALTAYAREKMDAATAWLQVYRWSALLAEREDALVPRWINTVQQAGVAHPNMAANYRARPVPVGLSVSRECQAWLIAHAGFAEEFFTVIQPVDNLPAVLRIINALHARDAGLFERYASLALAVAVVYDVPPPPDWPHRQVRAETLERKWADPGEAFAWWTNEDREGRTYHRLAELAAEELKFVIDTAAPFDELAWSQKVANYPLRQLERAYAMVGYRSDRAVNQLGVWPGETYSLPAILGAGGICVDQAYFATAVGKARGVPTLFFEGAGRDGRHAWFGFLDETRTWQLQAGRYAEQRFVTGFARDPQTWKVISDHELKFLAERFQTSAAFRRSRIHTDFAADFVARGDAEAAVRAARNAIKAERRNPRAWKTLLESEAMLGREAKQREATLREAVLAFQRYPDLEAYYSKQVSQSLRSRGQTSAADHEEMRIARKYQGDRTDLSINQARDILLRSIETQPLPEQIATYDSTLDRFGRRAGIGFFDGIVVVFVEHLLQLGQSQEALRSIERARGVLKVEAGSQLEREFERLAKAVKQRRR